MKLIFLVTLYKINLLDFNKWKYYSNKISKMDNIDLVFTTNNPNFPKDWREELEKKTSFIDVDPNIKKTRTILQTAKLINGDWVKVVDPDDDLIIENINLFYNYLKKINIKTVPLVEAGYKSYWEDGYFESGNLNRGFNHHAPNYSNVYNLKMLRNINEPKLNFTIWDDFFLASFISKEISIKLCPKILINITSYFNNIGMSNVTKKNMKKFNRENFLNLLDENLNFFKSFKENLDILSNTFFHERNKISMSQIRYVHHILIFSNFSVIERYKWAKKFSFIFKPIYINVKKPKFCKVTFLWKALIKEKL